MELLKNIQQGRLVARKTGDKIKSDLLTTIVGEFETLSKKGKELTDADLVALLKKFKANNLETLNVKPDDEILIKENEILDSYLPQQMTDEDLKNAIIRFIEVNEDVNMGKIMAHLKSTYAGLYDGKRASEIAKQCI